MALVFNAENFDSEVLGSELPVLVDFWAEWCGPCRMMGPVIDELATELQGIAKVGKLNVDACGEISMRYNVMSIPTLIAFRGGEPSGTIVGVTDKAKLRSLLGV